MKNKEKFAMKIVEIICSGERIAVNKETARPVVCNVFECDKCMFYLENKCKSKLLKEWAESEYIEKPVISKKDRVILDCIIGEFKYIARDRDNKLFLYEKEPYKNSDKSWVHIGVNCFCLNHRISVEFPMVKWEDEEPWLIEDLKKLEVVEEYEYLNK